MNPRKALETIYAAFALAVDNLDQRNSLLIQAVGIMDPICGSLQRMQQQNPSVKYLPDDSERLWDKAKKCRARALGTPYPEEKETSLRMCLQFMCRMAASLNPPKVETAIGELNANMALVAAGGVLKGRKPVTPRQPRPAGSPAPSNIPTIGANGIPQWKPGTSAYICVNLFNQVLSGDSITLEHMITCAAAAGLKSSNTAARIKMVAAWMVKAGVIQKARVGGKPGWRKV